ncbi:MAG: hypothetical protein ACK4ND_17735 [Cytophagaceae bacterium]
MLGLVYELGIEAPIFNRANSARRELAGGGTDPDKKVGTGIAANYSYPHGMHTAPREPFGVARPKATPIYFKR